MAKGEETRPDVLIIGAGVIGICSAYFLASHGHQVTIVDQGEIGAGSSYGNAGLIVPSHLIPLAAPGVLAQGLKWMLDPESPFFIKPRLDRDLISWLWRFRASCKEELVEKAVPVFRHLGQVSARLYQELVTREKLTCHYQQIGLLTLYKTKHNLDEGRAEAQLLLDNGIPVQVLDQAGVRNLEPAANNQILGGIYFEKDAHLDPALFVAGLSERLSQMGVVFHTDTKVTGFEMSGGNIQAVRSSSGTYYPQQVVLAAGSWSPELAEALQIKIPIQPAKGYSITVQRPENGPRLPMMLGESRVAVTPMGPLLRFAGTLELAGFDMSINRRRVEAILRAAGSYLSNGAAERPVIEIWRGLRPCTPDGLPVVGRSSSAKNLIVATGHATVGMSLGPVTGQLVSQIASEEKPEIDTHALRIDRFA